MYKHTHTVAQQERLLAREAMDDMGQSNLRDLYLDIGDEAIECLILLSLLEHTPNLEKLRLPKLYNGDSFRRIAEVFRDKEDLNLKHLFLECSSCDSIDGIKELFHTIGEIRGLQSLEIKNHSDMGPTIIPECFDLSLTKLSIFSCIHILTLTETLNRLPHLMSLEARVHLDLTETIIGTSWACIGLKKLSLEIISATGNVELVEYIFNQIGSFKDLEELRLDGDQYHLRLKEGYLRSLEHLTKLREISIQPFGYSPHVREAQWFVDHWGCLSLFRFESQSSPPCYQKFYNEGRYNRFIKRLLSSRPWIQIEIEEKVINP
ncbi:hypothetical protein BGZ46_005254 [Entomortierella lignicola]|nr:hypothetical protein BGZ46_005254 [Entomortierella lignicola]